MKANSTVVDMGTSTVLVRLSLETRFEKPEVNDEGTLSHDHLALKVASELSGLETWDPYICKNRGTVEKHFFNHSS
jgi:hypothetical protein